MHADQTIISRDASSALHRGVFEIELTGLRHGAE